MFCETLEWFCERRTNESIQEYMQSQQRLKKNNDTFSAGDKR
jgi:hypothetical protein